MIKSDSFAKDGKLYNALHEPSNRLITSAVITCLMLLVATGLSFFLPTGLVLAALFAPGVLTFALGGIPSRRHYLYQLSTNQRLAIERYMNADDETKKSFPKDWVDTVRSASTDGHMDEDYRLAVAAEKLINASKKRQKALRTGNDKVEVALLMLTENIESLERDAESREEVFGEESRQEVFGRKPKKMVGRKIQDR